MLPILQVINDCATGLHVSWAKKIAEFRARLDKDFEARSGACGCTALLVALDLKVDVAAGQRIWEKEEKRSFSTSRTEEMGQSGLRMNSRCLLSVPSQ